jgi:hypothetical protein
MESLERLASSIAQVELLAASLKRENRDLAGRLAVVASERLEERTSAEARIQALSLEVEAARSEPRLDLELEARARRAESEGLALARELDAAQNRHRGEKGRLEALIRQLEAQTMPGQVLDQMPVASAEALALAHDGERRALAAQAEAQERSLALAAHLKDLQARLDSLLAAELKAVDEVESLKARHAAQEARIAELEGGLGERERLLGAAQTQLAGAEKMEAERAELRRQRREVAAFAKESHTLRRKVEELLATLESVRLG